MQGAKGDFGVRGEVRSGRTTTRCLGAKKSEPMMKKGQRTFSPVSSKVIGSFCQ
jgi:hypothetical protein